MKRFPVGNRALSVIAFSFLFAYVLSFLFEGRVLYGLLDAARLDASPYILSAIVAHCFGQFTCGLFCKSPARAKRTALASMGICLLFTAVFFFPLTKLWLAALIVCGYAAGCAVAAWGCFLKTYTPTNARIHSCADMLIGSNLIMIAINLIAANLSARAGLIGVLLCLSAGIMLTCRLPVEETATGEAFVPNAAFDIRTPMRVLFLFVATITVDSGLMYQVINPAFSHLTQLVSWYWAIPYIAALAVMRNLPGRINRPACLYIGMGMIMGAFLAFMLLGRTAADYLIVDTLMLGACGIFDLFWWSILGEMLDYARNPVAVFGVGLSANVFGVLLGDVIGMGVTAVRLPEEKIAVIALCVVCVTLMILPPLNRELARLLKTHAYLSAYSALPENAQRQIAAAVAPLSPLTARESDMLRLILDGKSNREIAAASFVSENTVKTHLKSIYSKYAVSSRSELISLLLRGQSR